MAKIAFVFPGQGAQYIGMGKELNDNYVSSENIFKKADEALGFSISKMIFEGDDETLKITENTQPAVLATSIACLQPLLEAGIKPDITAGLSLGEYSSLVAAQSFDFEDAIKVVRQRGKFMQEAVPIGKGTMAAIIGLSPEQVEDCCEKASSIGLVTPANYNCPGQIVIAGEVEAVEKATEFCNEVGARRAIILQVSAPFHCKMLEPAGKNLEKVLHDVKLNKLELPVVTNVTGSFIESEESITNFLVQQVSSAVKWEQCMKTMVDFGVDTFIEIGPGKVLSGFVKKYDRKLKTYNVEDLNSLQKTISELS